MTVKTKVVQFIAVVAIFLRHAGRYLYAFNGSDIYQGLGYIGVFMMMAGCVAYPLLAYLAAGTVKRGEKALPFVCSLGILAFFSEIPYNFFCQPLFPYVSIISRGDCYSLFLLAAIVFSLDMLHRHFKKHKYLSLLPAFLTVIYLILSLTLAIGFQNRLFTWGSFAFLNYAHFRNPLLTLFLGVYAVFLCGRTKSAAVKTLILVAFAALAALMACEYGAIGVLLVYAFYFLREKKGLMLLGFVGLTLLYSFIRSGVDLSSILSLAHNNLALLWPITGLFAAIPIYFHREEPAPDTDIHKSYVFYSAYPAQWFFIYLVVSVIMKIYA